MKISYLIPALFTPGIFTPSRRGSIYFLVPMTTKSTQHANLELSIACLKRMNLPTRSNICKLENSRRANANVEELSPRIKKEHF
jgi:hypothetical protein